MYRPQVTYCYVEYGEYKKFFNLFGKLVYYARIIIEKDAHYKDVVVFIDGTTPEELQAKLSNALPKIKTKYKIACPIIEKHTGKKLI